MTNTQQILTPESPVKAELDRLELIERVPELLPQAAVCKGYALILTLPSHRAVIAYVRERAAMSWPNADLKTARRNLRAAAADYEKRVSFRMSNTMTADEAPRYLESLHFCSLSAIMEARADAMHWHKVVKEMEYRARIKQSNKWAVARSRVTPI